MDQAEYIKKLERKIANQRKQLRWWNFERMRECRYWRRAALGYRKQIVDMGVKPSMVWRVLYRGSGNTLPFTTDK